MNKVFIDGNAGTTGLRIQSRLSTFDNIELFTLDDAVRKDPAARAEALNNCDIAFLCLPDDAAREAVSMISNPNVAVIDTSTAHRTNDDWVYGFAELSGQREKIAAARRVANPGCHASGFISLVAPLTENGIIASDAKLSAFSITGYSGGGKKMIAEYEDINRNHLLDAPRMYGISQKHKHLPEMQKICGLENAPVFCPVVAPFYSGMEVVVSLFASDIKGTAEDIKEIYKNQYQSGLISFVENADEASFYSSVALENKDSMQLTVSGNEERILLVSRFDNLGKGASGAAIQNMNIILGLPETTGLII